MRLLSFYGFRREVCNKRIRSKSIIAFLLTILALSAACSSPANETTEPASTETTTHTSAPTAMPTTAATSGISIEELRSQLLKTGNIFVVDVKTASELTGYPVATPSFIPDGFIRIEIPGAGGAFNVFKLGKPADTGGVEYPYSVHTIYSQTGEFSTSVPYFQIHQSRNKIGAAGESEFVRIGEYEGKKALLAEPEPPRLVLTWNDGTMYYSMEGLLIEPLDEETLIEVATSMEY